MWFNSMVSEEPYQGLNFQVVVSLNREATVKSEPERGDARLSSARGVSCILKCRNERNPYPVLYFHRRLPSTLNTSSKWNKETKEQKDKETKKFLCFSVSMFLCSYFVHLRAEWREEGGDDVKSACPLCSGLHTCYNGRYNGLPSRKTEPIPKNRSQFRLRSATRPHEVGIGSNRESEGRGEYVLGSCTHRPS